MILCTVLALMTNIVCVLLSDADPSPYRSFTLPSQFTLPSELHHSGYSKCGNGQI